MPCENLGWRHRIAHVLGIANPRVCLSELAKFSLADFKKGLEDDIMTKANVHLIEDESLGGLLREYAESDRKAVAGDYVIITEFCGEVVKHIAKVTDTDEAANQFDFTPGISGDFSNDHIFDYDYETCKTLDPTDIVHVDGVRYKLVDRKAEVGEKVIIVNAKKTERNRCPFNNGHISKVINTSEDSVKIKPFANIYDYEYRVLEQVEEPKVYTFDSCEKELGDIACTNSKGRNYCSRICADKAEGNHVEVDESQASPEVIDMLGNLAQRIVKLESQVEDNLEALEGQALTIKRLEDEIDTLHSNQKRMAEELENAKPVEVTTPTFEIDSAEVIVELAKLLARESRKVGRL